MENITTVSGIKDAIRQLQEKQVVEGHELKERFLVVVDSVKPVNLIKSTFNDLTSSPDLLSNILSTTIGLTAGYLTNKTLVMSTGGALKKLIGTVLQFGVTSVFVRNPEAVKSLGQSFIQRFLSKKKVPS